MALPCALAIECEELWVAAGLCSYLNFPPNIEPRRSNLGVWLLALTGMTILNSWLDRALCIRAGCSRMSTTMAAALFRGLQLFISLPVGGRFS